MRHGLILLLLASCAPLPRSPVFDRAAVSHEGFVFGLALRPGSTHLYSCARDRLLVRYLFPELQTAGCAEGPSEFTCVAASDDGRWIVTSEASGDIALWDADTLKCVRRVRAHQTMAYAVAIAGARLASAGFDSRIRVWNFPDLTEHAELNIEAEAALALSFLCPDVLVWGQTDGVVGTWNLRANLRRTSKPHQAAVGGIACAADGSAVVTCGWDGRLVLLDPRTLNILWSRQAHGEAVDAIALSPDGRWIFTGDWSGEAAQWDRGSGTEVHRWNAHV